MGVLDVVMIWKWDDYFSVVSGNYPGLTVFFRKNNLGDAFQSCRKFMLNVENNLIG